MLCPKTLFLLMLLVAATLPLAARAAEPSPPAFDGRYISGQGDLDYLQLLDTSYRMLHPDPELQDISMLYSPAWNGFVEGPTWGAWWIQNSYGPSYCGMPFFTEPLAAFLRNAQELWFSQMGDGKRKGGNNWVAPDGCLCDCASPGWIMYRQGDGRTDIHDWGMEFTAAGLLLQSEMLLVERDPAAVRHYLPMLERCADFLDSRRDPKNNLFLAGPAGNLLAPSFAGCKLPDGSYGKAYLAGLSITTIAALDRLIEVEKLAGRAAKAALYADRRDLARKGLPALATDEGYFVKSIDPDGTRHGVYGAPKYGYFEAVCNHDAVAFDVVDDAQAAKICDKIAAIPGLRPHDLIITNYPSLDDMYEQPRGLWGFGTWVNGGHWTTCEARMLMAYARVGRWEDARRSMKAMLRFARQFKMDNPLVDFGNAPYQPNLPINCVYDNWGSPTGLLRGLFEYRYLADRLVLVPHIPPGITRLEQRFPVRFGKKRLTLSTAGRGPVTGLWVNGRRWRSFDARTVTLAYNRLPDAAQVAIGLGGAQPGRPAPLPAAAAPAVPPPGDAFWDLSDLGFAADDNLRPLLIGTDSLGGTRFVGDIRRVRLFRRALNDKEIAALAQEPTAAPPADAPLAADYLFDRLENGVFASRAGDAPALKPVGPAALVDAPGGKAVRLDGQGYLEAPVDPRLVLHGGYTLEAWIRPGKLPDSGGRIIDRMTAGVDDGYLLDTHPGSSLRMITRQGVVSFDARLAPDTWAHVAGTFEPRAGLRLYLNGKQVASAPPKEVQADVSLAKVGQFYARLCKAGLGGTYEAAHARLVVEYVEAIHTRAKLKAAGRLWPLPPASQSAADKSYLDAVNRLADGLQRLLLSYEKSPDARKRRLLALWRGGA